MACWSTGQALEDRQAALLVDLVDEVGRVVGLHAREQSRGLDVAARLEELELVRRVELLEDVGLELAVEPDGLDDLLALLVTGLLDEVGDLGRVQLGQLAVRDAQARRRHVRDERLDGGEVDDRLGLDALAHALAEQAAQEAADVRGRRPRPPSVPSIWAISISLAMISRPRTRLIEVARQQVLGQEQLAGATLEATQVDALALEGHAALGQAADLADGHEEVAALDADDRAHDRAGARRRRGARPGPGRDRSGHRPESKIGRRRNVERWRISVMDGL